MLTLARNYLLQRQKSHRMKFKIELKIPKCIHRGRGKNPEIHSKQSMPCQPVSSGTGQWRILLYKGRSKVREDKEPDLGGGWGGGLDWESVCHRRQERVFRKARQSLKPHFGRLPSFAEGQPSLTFIVWHQQMLGVEAVSSCHCHRVALSRRV